MPDRDYDSGLAAFTLACHNGIGEQKHKENTEQYRSKSHVISVAESPTATSIDARWGSHLRVND